MSEYTADLTEMLLTAAEPEPHIVIAADRSVLVPDDLKEIAAQFDHNIETVTFDCPRYWDGHDFSKMHVFVNYRCADGKIDSYPCDPPAVDAEDETIIHFDWTLSRNVTCAKGVISFLVCVKSSDENGVLQNQWSSRLNQEMEVLEGIECNTEEIIPDEPDVIERILNRLDALERNGGGGGVSAEQLKDAVNDALRQAKESGEFDGKDGKSAYLYAQDAGYTGTEEEFSEKLANGEEYLPDGVVKKVNGVSPDEDGNVEIEAKSLSDEEIIKLQSALQ